MGDITRTAKGHQEKYRAAFLIIIAFCILSVVSVGKAEAQKAPVISYFTPTGGPAGTQVTVVGENFTDNGASDLQVTLGDVQAQVLRLTDKELVFAVPPGAVTGQPKLQTSAGTATTADSFIVSPLTVSLNPSRVNILADFYRLINAAVIGDAGQGVTWSVNGILGGQESTGTVTQTNPTTYHAPAQAPEATAILITAASVANPAVWATARVTIINASGGFPDIDLPPADPADYTIDSEIWQPLSRTKLMVLLNNSNLAALMPLLNTINGEVIGTVPEINLVFVGIPDSDNLNAVNQAVTTLETSPSVVAVAPDSLLAPQRLPTQSTGNSWYLDGTDLTIYAAKDIWVWYLTPEFGHWGMEFANFPQAWNLYHYIKKQDRIVDVGIVDGAVDFSHPDLPRSIVTRESGGIQSPDDHGTHVAGIIGAKWDDIGLNGVSPFVRLYNQPTGDMAYEDFGQTFNSLGSIITDALRQLVRKRAEVKVINFSQGYNWKNNQSTGICIDKSVPKNGNCSDAVDVSIGPRFRNLEDPVPLGDKKLIEAPATPNNNPGQQKFVRGQGKIALATANYINNLQHPESGRQMIIVTSAGNDRADFSGGLHSTITAADRDRALQWNTINMEFNSPFTWAAYHGASNIVVVEALGNSGDRTVFQRSSFSNFAATWTGLSYGVSAPGQNILSTVAYKTTGTGDLYNNVYKMESGTSMAAPHVTGLIAYLYAVDPDLTIDNIMTILRQSSRASTTSAPAIDAFQAVMYIDEINKDNPSKRKWVKKALLNIDDGTIDGNDRTIDTDEYGTGLTPPDMRINMSDFRRFRDAYLQVLGRDVNFDGPKTGPKRDPNGDGVTSPGLEENVYPRGDFNGNGVISQIDLQEMADPDLWNDEVIADDGLTADQLYAKLQPLLISGDIKLDADVLFGDPAIDNIKVQAKVKTAEGVYEVYNIKLTADDVNTGSDKRKILTLPADKPIQLWATAYQGTERKYFLLSPDAPKEFQIKEGEDKILKLGKVKVTLSPDALKVSYDDKVIVNVALTVDGVPVDFDPNQYDVAFTVPVSLGSISQTSQGYQLSTAENPGDFLIKAVVSTKEGDTVNPFDMPFAISEATVRTAVVKSPGGLALDRAGNIYVTDTDSGNLIFIPPLGEGLNLLTGLNRPGPVEVDARGKSVIVAEANGQISRYYFGLSGKVVDTAQNLLVGAAVYIETPAGTLPGEAAKDNRYRTNVDGSFNVPGLLKPEMGLEPIKIVVTIEYEGQSQAFPLTLETIGQTVKQFVFNP